MEYARPTLIGSVRQARNTTRPVGMPNPYEGLGRGISNGLNTALNIGDKVVRYAVSEAEKQHNADLSKAWLDFERERDEGIQGIFQQGGANVTDRVDEFYEKLIPKYAGKLFGDYADKFTRQATTQWNAHMRKARDSQHEYQRTVNAEGLTSTCTSNQALFVQTGDMNLIVQNDEAIEAYYRTLSSFGTTPDEDLTSFLEDINDGDEFYNTPKRVMPNGTVIGGERIKIGDGPGEISRDKLNAIQRDLEHRANQYKLHRQSNIDSMHGAYIEALLKEDRVEEASEYINVAGRGGYGDKLGMSEAVLGQYTKLVGVRMDTKNMQNIVGSDLEAIGLKAQKNTLSNGGKYLTTEEQSHYWNYLNELLKLGKDEEYKYAYGKIQKIIQVKENNFKADFEFRMETLEKNGGLAPDQIAGTYSAVLDKIKSGSADAVDEAIAKSIGTTLARQVAKTKAPEVSARIEKDFQKQSLFLTYFVTSGQKQQIRIGDKTYELDKNNREATNTALSALGYKKDEITQFWKNIDGVGEHTATVAEDLAKWLNEGLGVEDSATQKFTADNVVVVAPFLVNVALNEYAKYADLSKTGGLSANDNAIFKTTMLRYIQANPTALKTLLEKGIDDNGFVKRNKNGGLEIDVAAYQKNFFSEDTLKLMGRVLDDINALQTGVVKGKTELPTTYVGAGVSGEKKEETPSGRTYTQAEADRHSEFLVKFRQISLDPDLDEATRQQEIATLQSQYKDVIESMNLGGE